MMRWFSTAESFQKRGETNRVASDVHQATFWNQGTLVNIDIFTNSCTTDARITSRFTSVYYALYEFMVVLSFFASTAWPSIPPT
jgi:hypothetical protein